MKDRAVSLLLADLNTEILILKTRIAPDGFESFVADPVKFRATERSIMNISEAVRLLPTHLLSAHPNIPWQDIKEIGSVLRHDYHETSPVILWDVITRHLNPLEKALAAIEATLLQDA